MFQWDEAKRDATLRKHGIDFIDAIGIFNGPCLHLFTSSDDELRRIAVGDMNGTINAVVYTMGGDSTRIITARRARRHE